MRTTEPIAIGTECLVSSRVSLDGARTWHTGYDGTPRRFALLDIATDSQDGVTDIYVFAAGYEGGYISKYRHEIEPFDVQTEHTVGHEREVNQ